MANKRISELNPITAIELAVDDLLLVSDVSAHESKRLTIEDLDAYVLNGLGGSSSKLTGSLYGTASWAITAVTALNAPLPLSVSYASSSTWASNAFTASHALNALSASYAYSGSNALTASYALTALVSSTITAAFALNARTASYLAYVPGLPNGTASFAITSSHNIGTSSFAISCSHALTASYIESGAFWNSFGTPIAALSASWASHSYNSEYSTMSLWAYTASHLAYTGIFNGTASYALMTPIIAENRINYGVFKAINQYNQIATLDDVNIAPTVTGDKSSSFEACGTLIFPITSSAVVTNGNIELWALNRWSGISQSLDSSSIYSDIGITTTGKLKYPFTLLGDAPLEGNIEVYVSASNGILLDPSRRVRFNIYSLSDVLTVSAGETKQFSAYPTAALMTYTSSGVLYSGTAANVVAAGPTTITEINASGGGFTEFRYIWTLPSLTKFKCINNIGLEDIGGMPPTILYLNCQSSSITELAPFNNSGLTYLNCSRNILNSLPLLPNTLTYLNCSENIGITSLPTSLPTSLVTIIADNTRITSPPLFVPNTLVSMSFANISTLTTWYTSFPTSLQYFDINLCPYINQLPTLPTTMKYLWVNNCSMGSVSMDNICTQLVTNGLSNGILALQGNSTYLPATLVSIATLQSRGWTVTY